MGWANGQTVEATRAAETVSALTASLRELGRVVEGKAGTQVNPNPRRPRSIPVDPSPVHCEAQQAGLGCVGR